ncbi:MAG: deoxyribose-phosphate aldolase, partial [Litorilinea sp.]
MQKSVEKIVQDAQARLATFAYTEPEAAMLPRLTVAQIAALIDHTALKADTGTERIEKLCREAADHHFASVCVNPTWVAFCHARLAESSMAICTVIGFPLGATLTAVKVFETNAVTEMGATEVDMVLNIGALRDGDYA